MGLFDTYKGGGLFNADPATQDAINSYAAMPAQPQGKGGLFGSGYNGEDIMNMLLRAASIAQGDYGSGAAFGENIGRRAREAAAEAAKRQQERDDYVWKKETDQRFASPKEPTELQQKIEYLRTQPGYENMSVAQLLDILQPVTGMVNGTSQVYPRAGMPGTPPPPDTLPPEVVGRLSGGGAVGNDSSGFRVNIPRIRP